MKVNRELLPVSLHAAAVSLNSDLLHGMIGLGYQVCVHQ